MLLSSKLYNDCMQNLTFPESISSRCAADAAFTRADVAAAMDLAASKITSSKFHDASAAS